MCTATSFNATPHNDSARRSRGVIPSFAAASSYKRDLQERGVLPQFTFEAGGAVLRDGGLIFLSVSL